MIDRQKINDAIIAIQLLIIFVFMVFFWQGAIFKSKGKRYTYCDGLRHLAAYHGQNIDLSECSGVPKTNIQIKLAK